MFVPTVCGMVFGSWLARRIAGKIADGRILRFAYLWMAGAATLNIAVCIILPASPWVNIAPIVFYNVGMALAMPVLSVAALDCHPRVRGTAASGQAFVQMLLSTVSAGALIPLLWGQPVGLAFGMSLYAILGWLCVRRTAAWKKLL
jgi:DHA1 family bicyclomycin/chloramphenicol resistance-like MFS transporter